VAAEQQLDLREARVNICVQGLWHLGCVTAACLVEAGHTVVGLDGDPQLIADLQRGVPPLFEPGLAELIAQGQSGNRLSFTTDSAAALRDAEVLWVSFDTPVNDDDQADVDFVIRRIEDGFVHLRDGCVVMVSSQLPVGSVRRLSETFQRGAVGRTVAFASVPENLRLGHAIDTFRHAERFVIGLDSMGTDHARRTISQLLDRFSPQLVWTSVESAEVVKHALNAYLATNIAFINEIAAICEQVGADASEVERGLRTDSRVGPKAYVRAGPPFAGGTLARDVVFLTGIGARLNLELPLLGSLLASNEIQRLWPLRRLREATGELAGCRIAIWGLAYKPGTSTLRRSTAIEICRELAAEGARVRAFDPAVGEIPAELADFVTLTSSAAEALDGTCALIVTTDWQEFHEVSADTIATRMAQSLVIDQYRLLADCLQQDERIRYVTIGRPI
jgi:UDPglucose 6-dehydrogenase